MAVGTLGHLTASVACHLAIVYCITFFLLDVNCTGKATCAWQIVCPFSILKGKRDSKDDATEIQMSSGVKAETTRRAHHGSLFESSGDFAQRALPRRHTSKTTVRSTGPIINLFEITR